MRRTATGALFETGAEAADIGDCRGLGVTQLLRRILAEEAAITPAMALRLGKFWGNGPDLRLRMQQADDLWHAQKALRKQLSKIPAAGEAN